MLRFSLFYAIVCVAVWAGPVWSHGVRGISEKNTGIQVTAQYDDGGPMQYAAVEVMAPGEGPVFQTGRTDRNGIFMFAPDQPGRWRVVVNDGLGHRLVVGRQIGPESASADGAVSEKISSDREGSRAQGLISGLSILFGLSGVLYGWKTRRRQPTGHKG